MVIRHEFRQYFGLDMIDECGFFLDMHLSSMILDFMDWVCYPKSAKGTSHVLKGHSDTVLSSVMSNDGRILYTCSDDRSIISWNMEHDYYMLKRIKNAHSKGVFCLAFHSGILVSGGRDSYIRMWNADKDCRLMRTLKDHTDEVHCVAFNLKGNRLVSGSGDTSIRVWSVDSGSCLRVLSGHTRNVSQVQFIDSCLVSVSFDYTIKVWNTRDDDYSMIRSINYRSEGSTVAIEMSLNSDASLLALLGHFNSTVRKWPDLEDQVRNDYDVHNCGMFHPRNPQLMAIGGYSTDPPIFFVDARTGAEIAVFSGHTDSVTCLCFSRDGTRMISGSEDHTVRVWDVSEFG